MANYNNSAEMMDEASVDNSTGVASTKKLTKAQKQAMDQAAWRQADSQSAFGEAAYNRAQEGAQDVIGSVVQQSNYKGGDEDYLNDIAGIGSMNSKQLDEAVAQKQGALAKLGNATLNNLTLAGTTAAMGTVGFIDGLLETVFGLGADAYAAATGQYKEGDVAKSLSRMWDNVTNRALTDIQTAAQEHFNIYKSKEWQDSSLGSKMGTVNFWADLWQNMGFTEGMALQAAMTMGLGSAAAANNMAKVSNWIYKMNNPLMSAIGEAATEAIHNKNEYVKDKELKLTQEYNRQMEQFGDNNETLGIEAQKNFQRKMEEVQNDAVAQGNFIGLTNIILLSITNGIEFSSLFGKGYDSSRRMALNYNKEAAENAIRNGKTIGNEAAAKTALKKLGQSEDAIEAKNIDKTVTYLHDESKSIAKQTKKLEKQLKKETDVTRQNELKKQLDDLAERQSNIDAVKAQIDLKSKVGSTDPFSAEKKWETVSKAVGRGLLHSVLEGFEETAQNWMRSFAGNNATWDQFKDSDWNNFKRAEFNNNWGDQLSDLLTSIHNTEMWNKDIAYEAMMGFLTGALGVPGIKVGRPGWSGGMIEPINDALKARRKAVETAQILNERLYNNKQFQAFSKGFVRHQAYEDVKTAAAQVNDRKAWNDADAKQLISDVIMFDEAGHLDKLSGLYKTALGELSDEDINQMVAETTKLNDRKEPDGPWINERGEAMKPDEVRAKIQEKADRLENTINRYKASLADTRSKFPQLNEDSQKAIAYLNAMHDDVLNRVKSLFDKFKKGKAKSIFTRALEVLPSILRTEAQNRWSGSALGANIIDINANPEAFLENNPNFSESVGFLQDILDAANSEDPNAYTTPFKKIMQRIGNLTNQKIKALEASGKEVTAEEAEKILEKTKKDVRDTVAAELKALTSEAVNDPFSMGFNTSEELADLNLDSESLAKDIKDYVDLLLDVQSLYDQAKDIKENPVVSNESEAKREDEAVEEKKKDDSKKAAKEEDEKLAKKIEELNDAYETGDPKEIYAAWSGVPINSELEDKILKSEDSSEDVKQGVLNRRKLYKFQKRCAGDDFKKYLKSLVVKLKDKTKHLFTPEEIDALAKCFRSFIDQYSDALTVDDLVEQIGGDLRKAFDEFYDEYKKPDALTSESFPGMDEAFSTFQRAFTEAYTAYANDPMTVEQLIAKLNMDAEIASKVKSAKSERSKDAEVLGSSSDVVEESDDKDIPSKTDKDLSFLDEEGAPIGGSKAKKGSDVKKADDEKSEKKAPSKPVVAPEEKSAADDNSELEDKVFVEDNENIDVDPNDEEDLPKGESEKGEYKTGYMKSAVDVQHRVSKKDVEASEGQLPEGHIGSFMSPDESIFMKLPDGTIVNPYKDAYGVLEQFGATGESLRKKLSKVAEQIDKGEHPKIYFVTNGATYPRVVTDPKTKEKSVVYEPIVFMAVKDGDEYQIVGVAQEYGLCKKTQDAHNKFEAIKEGLLSDDAEEITIASENGSTYLDKFTVSPVTTEAGMVSNGSLAKEDAVYDLTSLAAANHKQPNEIPIVYYTRNSDAPVIYGTKEDGSPLTSDDIDNADKASKLPGQIFIAVPNANGKYSLVATRGKKVYDMGSVEKYIIEKFAESATSSLFIAAEEFATAASNDEKKIALNHANEALKLMIDLLRSKYNISNIAFRVKVNDDNTLSLEIAPLLINEETGKHETYTDKTGAKRNKVAWKNEVLVGVNGNTAFESDLAKALVSAGLTVSAVVDSTMGLDTVVDVEEGVEVKTIDTLETNVNPFEDTFKNPTVLAKPIKFKGSSVDEETWQKNGPKQYMQQKHDEEVAKARKNVEKEKEKSTPEEMTAKFGEPVVIYQSTKEGEYKTDKGGAYRKFNTVTSSTPYWISSEKSTDNKGNSYDKLNIYYIDKDGIVQKVDNVYKRHQIIMEHILQNTFDVNEGHKSHNEMHWRVGDHKLHPGDFIELYFDGEVDADASNAAEAENLASFIHPHSYNGETVSHKMKVAVVPEHLANSIYAGISNSKNGKEKIKNYPTSNLVMDLVDGHILTIDEMAIMDDYILGNKQILGQKDSESEIGNSLDGMIANFESFGYTIKKTDGYVVRQAKAGKGESRYKKKKNATNEYLAIADPLDVIDEAAEEELLFNDDITDEKVNKRREENTAKAAKPADTSIIEEAAAATATPETTVSSTPEVTAVVPEATADTTSTTEKKSDGRRTHARKKANIATSSVSTTNSTTKLDLAENKPEIKPLADPENNDKSKIAKAEDEECK